MSGPKGGAPVDVVGLTYLLAGLKGPAFKDVNVELRAASKDIAEMIIPEVRAVVATSAAPQTAAFLPTIMVKRDRVPAVAIGGKNPKFRASKFTRRGPRRDGGERVDSIRRRGSLAHGILHGTAGGRRADAHPGDYYGIPRDEEGPIGRASDANGPVMAGACEAYLAAWLDILTRHGFMAGKGTG